MHDAQQALDNALSANHIIIDLLTYLVYLSSSAGFVGTFLASQRSPFTLLDLDIFSERARLASPWPLTSSHLSTASVYYLLDLSSFSLLSTLFCTSVFRRIFSFLQFFLTQGSSSTR